VFSLQSVTRCYKLDKFSVSQSISEELLWLRRGDSSKTERMGKVRAGSRYQKSGENTAD
jgi:hypothetical protein